MAADSPDDLHALDVLPAGTRFGELEIVRTLGVGGFGIVYLAQDHALQRQLAIKEYMPGQLAQRGGGSQVSVRADSLQETFDIGRRSFVNEARLLARFDHRALLKVYQFWEANGTAYMAMPYLQGLTLRQTRQVMPAGPPDEAWMRGLLLPLLDGLTLLHAEGVLHRDIAPDNILLPAASKDGGTDPILLDFGAARHAISDRTQTLTAILKPSYAPIEQYAEATALRQGPWTDLYALGAVAHYMLTGRPPPPSTARTLSDDYVPLASQALPGLSTAFLAAIDWALAVRPQDRPQTAAEMRAALLGQLSARPQPPAIARAEAPTLIDLGRLTAPASAVDLDLGPTIVTPAERPLPGFRAEREDPAAPSRMTGDKQRKRIQGAGALLVLGIAAAGVWWWLGRPAPHADLPPAVSAESTLANVASVASAAEAASAASSAALEVVAVEQPASAVSAPTEVAAVLKPPKPTVTKATTPALSYNAPLFRPPPAQGTHNAAIARNTPPPIPRQDGSMTLPTPPAEVVAPQKAPALVARAASQPATQAEAFAGPREACGNRIFILMSMCIARECKNPVYAEHPECVRLREIDEQRGRRIGQ
jgi:hypothetical protein